MRLNFFRSLINAYKTRKKYAGAMGIIGGSQGPTAVYWTDRCNHDEKIGQTAMEGKEC
jgi:Na+-transporting methylmalonyl-CoA/oxaloacetate decarboxylase beta subunit